MTGRTYRLKTPTLAILTLEDGHKIPITVPQGGTVQVNNQDLDDNRLVDVMWEGKTIMMFTIDLRDRAETVSPTNPADYSSLVQPNRQEIALPGPWPRTN